MNCERIRTQTTKRFFCCGFAATLQQLLVGGGISEIVCPRRVEARLSAGMCLGTGCARQHRSPKEHVGGTLFQSFHSHNLLVRITRSARLNAMHCYLMIDPAVTAKANNIRKDEGANGQ